MTRMERLMSMALRVRRRMLVREAQLNLVLHEGPVELHLATAMVAIQRGLEECSPVDVAVGFLLLQEILERIHPGDDAPLHDSRN